MKKTILIFILLIINMHATNFKHYKQDCDKNNEDSCYKLGLIYLQDKGGIKSNSEKAVPFIKKACQLGNAKACYKLAYYDLLTNEKKNYEKACNLGHKKSCLKLGDTYKRQRKYNLAFDFYNKACKPDACNTNCFELGYMYDKGFGTHVNKNKAAKLYQTACKAGRNIACQGLSFMYIYGEGVKKDLALGMQYAKNAYMNGGRSETYYELLALNFFNKLCDNGDKLACRISQTKNLYSKNKFLWLESINLIKKHCDNNDSEACFFLGIIRGKNFNELHESGTAKEAYEKSCKLNNANACLKIYYIHNTLDCTSSPCHTVNQEEAMKYAKKICKMDNAIGCSALAVKYETGQVTGNFDYYLSHPYFEKACNLGDYDYSCYILASKYYKGKNIDKNINKAIKLYDLACSVGKLDACSMLGKIYTSDTDVPQNLKLAEKYFQKSCCGSNSSCKIYNDYYILNVFQEACDLGDGVGCTSEGVMYMKNKSIVKNEFKAFKLFKQGCSNGDIKGCMKMGDMYLDGIGTRQSFSSAKEYYGKACDLGSRDGCKRYADLNKKGSSNAD